MSATTDAGPRRFAGPYCHARARSSGRREIDARIFLIVVCLITVVWVGGTAAVYAARRDWPQMRRFLFTFHPGVRGGPVVFWAALALVVLIRMAV